MAELLDQRETTLRIYVRSNTDLHNRILALLETLSHLQWLQKEGTVSRHDDEPISRYERVIR